VGYSLFHHPPSGTVTIGLGRLRQWRQMALCGRVCRWHGILEQDELGNSKEHLVRLRMALAG